MQVRYREMVRHMSGQLVIYREERLSPQPAATPIWEGAKQSWASDGDNQAKSKPGTLMGQSWTTLPMASCHFHLLPHVCPWRWGNGWRCFMLAWTQTKIYFSMPWWHVAPWPQGAVEKAEWWLHISQCFHSSSPCGSFTVFYQFIGSSPE